MSDRAKASLFDHTCDVMADMVGCATDQLPHVIIFVWIMALALFLPMSLPLMAFFRRRRDRIEVAEWEKRNGN